MKKLLIIVLALALLLLAGMGLQSCKRSRARQALAAYRAELRAQGEWLTLADVGIPLTQETNANLESFVALADQLRSVSSLPSQLVYQPIDDAGRRRLIWREPVAPGTSSNAPGLPWSQLSADCTAAAALLEALRVELEHPPRRFGWNFTNILAATGPKNPFVQKRIVAQFLTADMLVALHEGKLPRAQANLHALTQMVQLHRDDVTLVSAMIRVAIAGLSLTATGQALPAGGWDEAGLRTLQSDWEAIDLEQALETGLAGDRLFGLTAFEQVRNAPSKDQWRALTMTSPPGPGLDGWKERVEGTFVSAYWRSHMEEDELFYLRHLQGRLDLIRQLRTNAPGAQLKAAIDVQVKELDEITSDPLGKYRHLFSAIAIPNYSRCFQTTLRIETERRMTVIAIARQRFYLAHGHHPTTLAELQPRWLAKVPLDPWSGRPFIYRQQPDGSYILYSVGENGRDDGGDSPSADLWAGEDAIWPEPPSAR